MKTLFLIILLPLSFLLKADNISTTSTDPIVAEKKKVEVEVEVEIGRKKKNCGGFGVCGVVVSGGIKGVLGPDRVGATLTVQGGVVESITFHTETMDARTLKTYFASGIFTIGETFKEKIGKEGFIMNLKMGEYKLQRVKSGFLLEVSG